MTISEAAFHDIVRVWLTDRVGAGNLTHEPTLRTGREPDFLAEGPLATWAVEVENDADSLTDGFGQARLYAKHATEYVPLLVLPPVEASSRRELALLRDDVRIVELDPGTGDVLSGP